LLVGGAGFNYEINDFGVFNDIWLFDINSSLWSLSSGEQQATGPEFTFDFNFPTARFKHSALRVSNYLIILYGGQVGNITVNNTDDISFLNDIWSIIDTDHSCSCINGYCSPLLFHLDVCATCYSNFTVSGTTCDNRCLEPTCTITCFCNSTCRDSNIECYNIPTYEGNISNGYIYLNNSILVMNGTLIYTIITTNSTFDIQNGNINLRSSIVNSLYLVINASVVVLDTNSLLNTTCLNATDSVIIIDLSKVNATKQQQQKKFNYL